ncbi:unnamed protein product [Strongylus vulgaris]|uniref:Uncharacterized protein n=1 Tax=Strongylus vulgaris TaxID=40348 RepID=A0A3P7JJU2_STRVU|nr:unnamed protein product [Strongylus vulgaris]
MRNLADWVHDLREEKVMEAEVSGKTSMAPDLTSDLAAEHCELRKTIVLVGVSDEVPFAAAMFSLIDRLRKLLLLRRKKNCQFSVMPVETFPKTILYEGGKENFALIQLE